MQIIWFALLVFLPEVASYTSFCEKDSECKGILDSVCVKKYPVCKRGQCGCPPGKIKKDFGQDQSRLVRKCIKISYIGGECDGDEQNWKCTGGSVCDNNRCACPEQLVPTADGKQCRDKTKAELGQSCSSSDDCISLNAYHISPDQAKAWNPTLVCRAGRCDCYTGYEKVMLNGNWRCVKKQVGSNCTSADDCADAKATCARNKCKCENPRMALRFSEDVGFTYTKCVHNKAKKNRGLHRACNHLLIFWHQPSATLCHPSLDCIYCSEWKGYRCKIPTASSGTAPMTCCTFPLMFGEILSVLYLLFT